MLALSSNLELIANVLVTLLKTSDSWQQKKVKKTMLALNIYTKLGKNLSQSDNKNKFRSSFEKGGV